MQGLYGGFPGLVEEVILRQDCQFTVGCACPYSTPSKTVPPLLPILKPCILASADDVTLAQHQMSCCLQHAGVIWRLSRPRRGGDSPSRLPVHSWLRLPVQHSLQNSAATASYPQALHPGLADDVTLAQHQMSCCLRHAGDI